MIYAPIWQDTYYETTAATLTYKIVLDGEVIFSGKAYRMPNGDPIKININKICQNYLAQDLDGLLVGSASSIQNSDAIGDFRLTNGAGTTLETYRFLYDWDYDHSWGGAAATLSLPVNGEFISGQMKLRTTVTTGNTSTQNVVTTYRSTGNYDKEICGDYVLYYTNCRGGWDCFAFPKGEKSETITQHTYSKVYDNKTAEFETERYISEISTAYKLSTGILTDEQSILFAKHLVGSNKCYLHNVTDGWIRPVVLTETAVTYKDSSNTNEIVAYQVTVKESQTKQRM